MKKIYIKKKNKEIKLYVCPFCQKGDIKDKFYHISIYHKEKKLTLKEVNNSNKKANKLSKI